MNTGATQLLKIGELVLFYDGHVNLYNNSTKVAMLCGDKKLIATKNSVAIILEFDLHEIKVIVNDIIGWTNRNNVYQAL